MFGTQILVYATTFFSSYELVLVLLGQIELEDMMQAAGIPGLLFFLVSAAQLFTSRPAPAPPSPMSEPPSAGWGAAREPHGGTGALTPRARRAGVYSLDVLHHDERLPCHSG